MLLLATMMWRRPERKWSSTKEPLQPKEDGAAEAVVVVVVLEEVEEEAREEEEEEEEVVAEAEAGGVVDVEASKAMMMVMMTRKAPTVVAAAVVMVVVLAAAPQRVVELQDQQTLFLTTMTRSVSMWFGYQRHMPSHTSQRTHRLKRLTRRRPRSGFEREKMERSKSVVLILRFGRMPNK